MSNTDTAVSTLAVHANGQSIAYRVDGPPSGAPIVLIHGLGQTLTDWPQELVDRLSKAGRHVARMDNRDVGRSTRLDHLGEPALARLWISAALRLPPLAKPVYCIRDMADDVVALLDGLGLPAAHLVGASMGGMIAQHVAIAHPERVLSLTSIMSSSGAPGLPGPRRDVQAALGKGGSAPDLMSATERALRFRRLVAGGLSHRDDEELAQRVAVSSAYGWPEGLGSTRQYAAILADRDRYRLLSQVGARSLVIHGADDPFLPLAHGQDTAARIGGSRFIAVRGMGHEITLSATQVIADSILEHIGSGPGT